jgi:hypothetical protein
MLKVTIELIPFGDASKAREISSFYIANDGTGSSQIGNYLFRKKEEDDWEKSVQSWHRTLPVERLVEQTIKQHYSSTGNHQ